MNREVGTGLTDGEYEARRRARRPVREAAHPAASDRTTHPKLRAAGIGVLIATPAVCGLLAMLAAQALTDSDWLVHMGFGEYFLLALLLIGVPGCALGVVLLLLANGSDRLALGLGGVVAVVGLALAGLLMSWPLAAIVASAVVLVLALVVVIARSTAA